MKNKFVLMLACLLTAGAWFTPPLCAENEQLTAAGGNDYIVWEPQIGDPSQIKSNSISIADAADYANLIDNNVETIFHSIWDASMQNAGITADEWVTKLATLSGGVNSDPGYHFLQVEFIEPVSSFRFEYKGRNSTWLFDNPNDIAIYATNDPGLGANATNSNQDQWTFITELTPENGNFPGNVVWITEPYESPEITLTEPFKYVRFVVKGTTNMNTNTSRTFAAPEVTGVTFAISEFQVYSPREATGSRDILQALVDSINTMLPTYDFVVGTDPGYADDTKYSTIKTLFEEAQTALLDNLSEEELADYVVRLRNGLADFLATGINPVVTGYYNIVCAYPGYEQKQGKTKSMGVNSQKQLIWEDTDPMKAAQLWLVTKLDNGNYSIQNVASGEYIGAQDPNDNPILMTPAHSVDQIFIWEKQYAGQFHIANVLDSTSYHTSGHSSGSGLTGRITPYPVKGNSQGTWYMRRVTDQEIIDKLVSEGSASLMKNAMRLALDSAIASRSKANEYAPLITRAEQLSSNAQSADPYDYSSFANLIDGNTSTIFHSIWEAGFASPVALGDSYGWHNLQVALDEPVAKMILGFSGRVTTGTYTDTPDHITVYGTNDDALGASTAAADSSKWTMIVDMTNEEYDFPPNGSGAVYESPVIDFGGQSYKYLRFAVMHTTTMNPGNSRAGAFASPQATGVTFNLSEFQVYDANPTEKSQYFTVPGMKEACDALDEAIAAAQAKLESGDITDADISALRAAYALVDEIYVDRNEVFDELSALLETANNVYDVALGSRVALITDASQINTNSLDDGPNTGYASIAALIDGDKSTIFHSVWDAVMANPDITVDEWETQLTNNYPSSTGAGYHNLGVALKEPVSSFSFEYYGRDAIWHDNPTDIEIYATNDAELYEDVSASSSSSWTKITELTEGFPMDIAYEVPYTSPQINLGGEYKYIRFVIKNSCLANQGGTAGRVFSAPDVTGITWSVTEFQMYTGLAAESIQYNYIPEVRTAADELKALIDLYGQYTAQDITSRTPVEELSAAIKKLQEAYVDTTELVELYDEYKQLAAVSEEGETVGYVDSYAEIEKFDALLDEARALVSPKQPTKEQVNNATAMVKSGYDEFMSHVILPEPYAWYLIRSGVTDENYQYAINQPVFLADVSAGAQLRIGNYPMDDTGNEYLDVYAIWRLVPVGGNELAPEGQEVKPWEQKYAIQSLGTGQYWGAYRGQGAAYSPLMSNEQTPYNISYYGKGCFALQQDGVEDPFDRIKADGTEFVVLNYPANSGDQQSWKFDRVDEETDLVQINWFPAQSTSIVTLPIDLTGDYALNNLNSYVETYVVNSVVKDGNTGDGEPSYTLTLTAKDEFKAGEPFVLVTTAEPDENGQQPLAFLLPPAEAGAITDTSAVDCNGLVGTLEGMNISGQASLYFDDSELNVCSSSAVFVPGRSGYIDVARVQDLGGSIDKTISINGVINNIANVEISAGDNASVDVYTVDGVLLKRNVKVAEATKNLPKGIYIVGKKKVLVK